MADDAATKAQERETLLRICNKVQQLFVDEQADWPTVMSVLTNLTAANIVAQVGLIPGAARNCSNMFSQQLNHAITQKIVAEHEAQVNGGSPQ